MSYGGLQGFNWLWEVGEQLKTVSGGGRPESLVLNIYLGSDTMMTFVELPGRALKYSWRITNLVVEYCSQLFSQSDKIFFLEGAAPNDGS